MNLVVKEGALLNERDGVILMARTLGAWHEMGRGALEVHPLDPSGTARSLTRAFEMTDRERRERSESMRCRVVRQNPASWLEAQLETLFPGSHHASEAAAS